MASKQGDHCTRCGKKCNVIERLIDEKRYRVWTCPGSEVRKNTWVGSHGEQRRELIVPVEGTVE